MDCVVCNKTGATYRLVDSRASAICEQCVAEHLADDVDNDECMYCGAAGDYDLVEYMGAVVAADDEAAEDYEPVTESVVCRHHLSDLIAEGT